MAKQQPLEHFFCETAKTDYQGQAYTPPDTEDALHLTMLRNQFYKDAYRNLLKIILLLLVVIGCQVGLIKYLSGSQIGPRYVATNDEGTPMKIVSVSRPHLTHNELLRWANDAAIASYTFNFANFRGALQSVRSYYTPIGYQKYIKALKDSRNLEAVKAEKYVVSAIATKQPKILKERFPKKSGDRMSWIVEVPMLLTYQSPNKTRQQRVTMTMSIVRLPTLSSKNGLGISQVIVSEGHDSSLFDKKS